ncbi:hypothetical protein SAMN06296020_105121 [Anoxynatronum buryatiense]|uniref:Uncharacterized protein n=1 Tax=Anoxynatronum buryatiense TaxID=489973 RepID=A0AA45WVN2_9CLOT|nr:hypothetical protein SAMN06296020_105121 [Anoxynatronum buryatiense]
MRLDNITTIMFPSLEYVPFDLFQPVSGNSFIDLDNVNCVHSCLIEPHDLFHQLAGRLKNNLNFLQFLWNRDFVPLFLAKQLLFLPFCDTANKPLIQALFQYTKALVKSILLDYFLFSVTSARVETSVV